MRSSGTVKNGAEQAGRAAGYVAEATDAVKDYASDAAGRVAAAASEALEDPNRYARKSYVSVAKYAREKPLEALAIGAGVGFLIGALLKR